jgi:transposase-like protein
MSARPHIIWRGVVRWYLRFWLRYTDVAALLAERGVRVDPSGVFA